MGSQPTLPQVIAFVREFVGADPTTQIYPQTKLEADLSIYGEDGNLLLHEAESKFGVRFPKNEEAFRQVFLLRQDESLFSDEPHAFSSIVWLLRTIRGRATRGRDLSVAELCDALVRCNNAT